jgi:type III restriction enzyme
MKLHFEPNLDFQLAAIEAVYDVFRGQEVCRTEFTTTKDPSQQMWFRFPGVKTNLSIGNRRHLLDGEISERSQFVGNSEGARRRLRWALV